MAFLRKQMIRFNLTGIILVAFVAVSCANSMAEDFDDSDWTDDSNKSMDPKDPKDSQKKETEKSNMPMKFSLISGWTCLESFYDTNDGCDCGCGIIDPDCNGNSSADVCAFRECGDGSVDPNQNHLCLDTPVSIPTEWTCPDSYYGASDGCDCGCAAIDPDCQGIFNANMCEWDECGSPVNPDDNRFCIDAPRGWTCDPGYYGASDGCDCGCGVIDPDCYGDSSINACAYHLCDSGAEEYPNLNYLCKDQKIKIMPVGDSITAGEHYGFPDVEVRKGYREPLWNMLKVQDGFNVDFVGTVDEPKYKHGNQLNYDWHALAFHGEGIQFIADKLEDALPIDRPDILLIHVGTNGRYPNDVKDMLDMMNESDYPPSVVLLCRIIKRFNEDGNTKPFNDAVEDAALARTNDKFKLIMVDMESGAGFNYNGTSPRE